MLDKTSDGSTDTCSKCPPFVRTHARKCFYATRQYCIVNDALVHDVVPNVQQTLLQLVNAVQLRLMYSLQDVTPCNRSDWGRCYSTATDLEEWKWGVDCSRNRTLLRARCAGALCCWKMKKSPDTSHITGNVAYVAVIAAIDLHSRMDKDEVREAKLWDTDGHHNR